MTIHEIISLMGLKSTTPEITQFFETNSLGKPPKTVNNNQSQKSIPDKLNKLSFCFKYDITNEQFYPPVSPKQDDYNFISYLSSVVVLEVSGKKMVADPKPASFWDGFISPESTYDECKAFFANGEIKKTIMRKPLNDVVELVVWFSDDQSRLTTMELRIIEAREIFSMYELDARYTVNTVKQAYLLLVKWLFDNKYLLLPEQAFEAPLSFDDQDLLEFSGKYLKNHIWDSQLIDDKALISFLYGIASNSSSTTPAGERVNVYIKHLFIKAAGKWDEHQQVYNNETMDAVEAFERNLHLDEAQSNVFLQSLTEKFELFK